MIISGMLASSSVVHSTATNLVEMSAELVQDITTCMKNKTKNIAAAAGIAPDNELFLELMNSFESKSQPFKNLQTEYKPKNIF